MIRIFLDRHELGRHADTRHHTVFYQLEGVGGVTCFRFLNPRCAGFAGLSFVAFIPTSGTSFFKFLRSLSPLRFLRFCIGQFPAEVGPVRKLGDELFIDSHGLGVRRLRFPRPPGGME